MGAKKKKEPIVRDALKLFMDKQFPRLGREITAEEYDLFSRLAQLPLESRSLVMNAAEAWDRLQNPEWDG